MVERDLAKVEVASSSLVSRSKVSEEATRAVLAKASLQLLKPKVLSNKDFSKAKVLQTFINWFEQIQNPKSKIQNQTGGVAKW